MSKGTLPFYLEIEKTIQLTRRHLLQAAGAGLVPSLVQSEAWAKDAYPNRPITWVCPYAAGGNADIRSRQIAKNLGDVLGRPVVIDNRAGAGGNIGTSVIAKAKPDGYTIGMGNFGPLAINQHLFKNMNFDPLNDLVPIALIEKGPLILMVRSDSPYKSVKDIALAAKASAGRVSYASGGIGGSHHLCGTLFASASGAEILHAPFKSGSAATNALLGGQVEFMFELTYAALPSLQAGTLRPLAISSKTRSPLFPQVPTMIEQGYPTVDVLNWQGLVAPKGLPDALVQQLNNAVNKVLEQPDMRQKIMSQGNDVGGGSPQAFMDLIKAESQRWGKVVKEAKMEVF